MFISLQQMMGQWSTLNIKLWPLYSRGCNRQVERMAKQFKVAEDSSYTCETAAHFWLLHVLARWEKFKKEVSDHENTAESIKVGTPLLLLFEEGVS